MSDPKEPTKSVKSKEYTQMYWSVVRELISHRSAYSTHDDLMASLKIDPRKSKTYDAFLEVLAELQKDSTNAIRKETVKKFGFFNQQMLYSSSGIIFPKMLDQYDHFVGAMPRGDRWVYFGIDKINIEDIKDVIKNLCKFPEGNTFTPAELSQRVTSKDEYWCYCALTIIRKIDKGAQVIDFAVSGGLNDFIKTIGKPDGLMGGIKAMNKAMSATPQIPEFEYNDKRIMVDNKGGILYCMLIPSTKEKARRDKIAAEAQLQERKKKAEENRLAEIESKMLERATALFAAAKKEYESGRYDTAGRESLLLIMEKTSSHVKACRLVAGYTKLAESDMTAMEKELRVMQNR